MRKIWMLLLLPALIGCPTEEEPPEDIRYPIIVEANPEPGASDFFYQAELWVEFDVPPDSVSITLVDSAGSSLSGTQGEASAGRLVTFDPDADLVPRTSYSATITWAPTDVDPLVINFETGPHGTEIGDGVDSMIGTVFNIDLANATFIEPPGVGAIIGSQLDGVAILFTPTDESDFDPAVQPAMHILGALGSEEGGIVTQEECTETLAFTYGLDSAFGGGDDVPASFIDPVMDLGPTDLPLSIQGITATIQELRITGTFHPELDDMQGGTFGGKIDTRPLAPELDPDGGEDAICRLVSETVGVECEDCQDGEPFCLSILAGDIVAAEVPDLELTPYTCADLIDIYTDTGECDEALDFDEDGDGIYELCEIYVPPTTR